MIKASLVLAAGSMLDADPVTLATAAAAAGFDGVSVRLTTGEATDHTALTALTERAADLGVVVHDVEVYRIGDPLSAGPGPLIDAAVRLGARFLLVVSDLADEASTEERLGGIVAQAADVGVGVGIEYMAWTTPCDPHTAARVARATGASIVVDVLHHVRVGGDADSLSDVVASGRLGWVQLCDAPSSPPADLLHEARHARLPPGAGDLPLGEFLAVIPPATTISVEVQSDSLLTSHHPTERAHLLHAAATAVLSRPH